MAGSKKGERRGGRKAGVEPKPHPPRKQTKFAEHKDRHVNAPRRTEEYYNEITRAMTMADMSSQIEPREVVLEAMRYFHSRAMDERRNLEQLVETLPMIPKDSAAWPQVNEMLVQTEGRIERMHVMAVDAGFKVMPYIHARLSSIEHSTKDGKPLSVINVLMGEIAEATRARPSWMDEHEGPVLEQEPHIGEET